MAIVGTGGTLVNVSTSDAIAGETSVTSTSETGCSVVTSGIDVAIISLGGALVHIDASETVAVKTGVARAEE